MQSSTTLWVALAMISVSLAGCTGGGTLDMLVTAPEDPVTGTFLFEATGPSYETYSWDFGDGVIAAGEEVEHIYGFTNGDIIVRLTASNAGEDPVQIARTVNLGGTRNVNPTGVMTASTYWADPGETFSITAAGSTDPDGDPLLYRWTCLRVGDLEGPDTSHAAPDDFGGVPFGVDAWALLDTTVTGTNDLGADACNAIDVADTRPWSTEMESVTGSISESGEYTIELFVRDPKGAPWIGRTTLYVSEPDRLKPDPTFELLAGGTFNGGVGGELSDFYYNQADENIPAPYSVVGQDGTFDVVEIEFDVDIHSLAGEIKFSYEGGTVDAGTVAQYRIYPVGSGSNAINLQSGDRVVNKGDLKSNPDGTPRAHVLEIKIDQGAQVSFDFAMTYEKDLNPLRWYKEPTL